ncbi:MAG: hypothetical protein RB296_00015 [Acidobacteriota bacterium]|jgi:hypothetical protein|nr:hypothetical protein [Acidobacteriota bacterium]
MKNWKKIVDEAQMNRNARTRKGGNTLSITKSGSLTLSSALRGHLLTGNPEITHARPGYHPGEKLLMVEFLTNGRLDGARKISNLKTGKGTSALMIKSFLNQVGLDAKKVAGRYPAEPIRELDGEWWYCKLK